METEECALCALYNGVHHLEKVLIITSFVPVSFVTAVLRTRLVHLKKEKKI